MSRRTLVLLVAVLFFFANGALQQHARAQPTTGSVTLTVYDDGTASISQDIRALPNDTSVNTRLLSSVIADPVVVDQNGSSLYFQVAGTNVTIYTIGATQVTLQYDTGALTSKQGTVWTLAFQAYYNTTVVLPQQSILTSVSRTPDSLSTSNGSPVVVVSPGEWEIDYGLPIEVGSTSTTTTTSKGGSTESSVLGSTSSSSSTGLSQGTSAASSTVASSVSTQTSPSGGSSSSSSSPPSGGASTSTSSQAAETTTTSTSSASMAESLVAAVAIAAVAALGVLLLLLRKRKGGAARGREEEEQTPELRPDDTKVLQFIAEKGGRVLEPEIRMRFALPKTSAWRQIKRLERLGYVRVTKIGSQNQVELVKDRQNGPGP